MYKEVREMSRTDAVEAMYQDMAARHRARFRSIHVCDRVLLGNGHVANRINRFSRSLRFRTGVMSSALISSSSSSLD